MSPEILLVSMGIGSYAVASVMAVVALVRPGAARDKGISMLLVLGAIPLVAVLVMHGYQAGRIPAFSRFDALVCYGLAIVAAYLLMGRRRWTRGLSGFVVPYVTAVVALGAPPARAALEAAPRIQSAWLGIHIVTSLCAYALFSLAGILAAAYLVQDNNLKRKRLGRLFEGLPALETLDRLMSRQVGFAFLLLTVSIILGFMLVRLGGGGHEWLTDPKVVATLGTWVVYGLLVHMRASTGRHGRGVAIVTIIGFCCVLFTFVGVHAMAQTVHHFLLISVPVS